MHEATYQRLRSHLAYLKLTTAAEVLAARLDHAQQAKPSYTAFLEDLLGAEVEATERRRLAGRLARARVGVLGDLAYLGVDGLVPGLRGASPRRKPRGKDRPQEDKRYNRAFARRRVKVEHAIGRLRRFQALSAVNRHGRLRHEARVRAVAGLVNRLLDQKAS